jgi:hypothetical protein
MKESLADLEKRRDLLKEIKELSDSLPNEDEMEAASSHLATLKAIEETDSPDEDHMREVSDHLAALKEIAETDSPSEDEMRDVSDHLVTLKTIENRSN